MAKQTDIFAFRGVNLNAVSFLPADGTNDKPVISAGADDSVLRHLSLASRSTITENIEFLLSDGTASSLLMTVAVPARAGSDGNTGALDAFGGGLLAFFRALPLKAGWSLRAKPQAALMGEITITAITDDF